MRLVPAEPEHIPFIAANMREMDRIECGALGRSPVKALETSLRSSLWALTAIDEGEPHAMLGVSPFNMVEGVGVPWMLGTERIYARGRLLLRNAPPVLAAMRSTFPRLQNLVGAGNDRAKRFLRHVGFEISEDIVIVGGVDFQRFSYV